MLCMYKLFNMFSIRICVPKIETLCVLSSLEMSRLLIRSNFIIIKLNCNDICNCNWLTFSYENYYRYPYVLFTIQNNIWLLISVKTFSKSGPRLIHLLNSYIFLIYHKNIWGRILFQPVLIECQFFQGATGIRPSQAWERTDFEGWTSCQYLNTA